MKRKTAIVNIRAEVARQGKITGYATRLYIEGRMGRETFNKAVDEGIVIYNANQRGEVREGYL